MKIKFSYYKNIDKICASNRGYTNNIIKFYFNKNKIKLKNKY